MTFRVPVMLAAVLLAGTPSAHAQLRGHGGPVRALTLSADGATALSGSFDGSAIRCRSIAMPRPKSCVFTTMP